MQRRCKLVSEYCFELTVSSISTVLINNAYLISFNSRPLGKENTAL